MSEASKQPRTAADSTKENRQMPKRLASLAALIGTTALLLALAPVASADDPLAVDGFGIAAFDGEVTADAGGSPFTQAASSPYDAATQIKFNVYPNPDTFEFPPLITNEWPEEPLRDLAVELPSGLVGVASGMPTCAAADLAYEPNSVGEDGHIIEGPLCPPASQVGTIRVAGNGGTGLELPERPVFLMDPPPGVAVRLGANIAGVITIDAKPRDGGDYGVTLTSRYASEGQPVTGVKVRLWGVPWSSDHDSLRSCRGRDTPAGIPPGPSCTVDATPRPFLRLPTACGQPGSGLLTTAYANSYYHPAAFKPNGEPDLSDPNWKSASFESHLPPGLLSTPVVADPELWGAPQGPTGCLDVPVQGSLAAQPTSIDSETPTGFEVHVEVPNPGLESVGAISSSDFKSVKVTLPQGMTINPSQAEGLGVCSPAQYESSELSFYGTGPGCPTDSKIGTVEVKSPLLEETIPGEVFVAEQDDPSTSTPGAENPFDSLLAIYVVLKEPQRGVLVKLAGEVETDEKTGRIVTTFDDLPQLPFSTFDFRFREGARAPLVTPPTCGKYTTEAEFTPWSNPAATLKSTSSFEITRGIGGGPCPPDGVPGFDPGFSAGTINNNAGSFSPTVMRLTRRDGEQDLTKFSAVLPEGLLAKLAGVEKCSDAAIAATGGKTGRSELASPSCPANSQIGRTLVGAGVGSVLTYVPGSLYLAGPYNGAPLSVVAVTPAVAGPFDVGTVVVREALALDPVTGVASVDGAASDPIPHILKGIPLKLRDLRVYVDRPEFTINPTSCDPDQVGATLWGSAADVFNPADDVPVARSSRYQAANCLNLGFKPNLKINLRGATKRGKFPALRAVLTPRPGDANLERAAVVLPGSAFLEQGHIRTICTRVQYAAGAGHGSECPKGSRYGYARAWSPLLDQPLQGPVYLRSSSNKLPDMVLALKGIVDIEAVGRIDSVKLRGSGSGIRSLFASVPDAPLSRVVLNMQGGRKGLIVNSRNLCRGKNRARSNLTGQNGRRISTRPVVRALGCKKQRKAERSSHGRSARSSVAASSAVG